MDCGEGSFGFFFFFLFFFSFRSNISSDLIYHQRVSKCKKRERKREEKEIFKWLISMIEERDRERERLLYDEQDDGCRAQERKENNTTLKFANQDENENENENERSF